MADPWEKVVRGTGIRTQAAIRCRVGRKLNGGGATPSDPRGQTGSRRSGRRSTGKVGGNLPPEILPERTAGGTGPPERVQDTRRLRLMQYSLKREQTALWMATRGAVAAKEMSLNCDGTP
jgi:hypothetical protein